MRTVALIYVLLMIICSHAENAYVREGAYGTGSAGWSSGDACSAISTAENLAGRGDTIFLADGNYAGFTFNTPTSGTSKVTIVKATPSIHGTNNGWNNSYGDGLATIDVSTTGITVSTGYFKIDGVLGGYPSWTTGYGIKIKADDNTSYNSYITISANGHHLEVTHCDIGAEYRSYPGCDCIIYSVDGADSAMFTYNYIHHMGDVGFTVYDHTGWVFDHNFIYQIGRHGDKRGICGTDNQLNHGNIFELYNGDHFTISNNMIVDMVGSGSIGFYGNNKLSDLSVFGNVFYHEDEFYRSYTADGNTDSLISVDTRDLVINTTNDADRIVFYEVGAGVTGISANTPYHTINKNGTKFQLSTTAGGQALDFSGSGTLKRYYYFGSPGIVGNTSGAGGIKNLKFFHNTVANFPFADYWSLIIFTISHDSSGNLIKNNIFYDTHSNLPSYIAASATFGYNASNKELSGDANLQTLSSSPFVNITTDFSLTSGTDPGEILSDVPVDMIGNSRSTPDRGAFEFDGTPPAPQRRGGYFKWVR